MDLNQFTVLGDRDEVVDLVCERCPGFVAAASSEGVLGKVPQLPDPITLTSLLKAATVHNATVHKGGVT